MCEHINYCIIKLNTGSSLHYVINSLECIFITDGDWWKDQLILVLDLHAHGRGVLCVSCYPGVDVQEKPHKGRQKNQHPKSSKTTQSGCVYLTFRDCREDDLQSLDIIVLVLISKNHHVKGLPCMVRQTLPWGILVLPTYHTIILYWIIEK